MKDMNIDECRAHIEKILADENKTLSEEQRKFLYSEEFEEQAKHVGEQYVCFSLKEVFDQLDAEHREKGYEELAVSDVWDFEFPVCEECGRGHHTGGEWYCKHANTPECEHLDEIKVLVAQYEGLPGQVMEQLEIFMHQNGKNEKIQYETLEEMWNFLIADENKESLEKFYEKFLELTPGEQIEWADKVTDDITAIIQLAET